MRGFMVLIFLCFSQVVQSQTALQNDYALAENYLRQSEYEKAIQIYERLYKKSPFNTTYLQRLISCYQQTNKFEKAETVLMNRLKNNKDLPYLYVFLGYNFEKQQLIEKAELHYRKAIKAIHESPNYAGIVGRIFRDFNLLDYAIETYSIAMEKNKDANYNFQIAQIYGEKGEYEKMFQSYIDLIDKNKSFLDLTQRFASRYLSEDPENEINTLFRKTLLKKAISNPKDEWNILLSWFFALQGQYDKAFLQEKAIYQRNPEDLSEIFRLGRNAFYDKSYEASKQCFEFISSNTQVVDRLIEARLYLLKVAVKTKDENTNVKFQQAFDEFGITLNTIPLQIEYADYLTFDKGTPEAGQKILEKALELKPARFTKAKIQLKLGDILVFRGLYNSALIQFSKIQGQLKNSEIAQEARFKIAQTSYFKGDFPWAKAQLKVLKSSTTQRIANDAVDLFLKITDNEPVDSIATGLKQFAKAELFVYQNKNQQALEILDELIQNKEIFPNGLTASEVIFDDVLFFQAKVFLKENRYQEAIANLETIAKTDPRSFLADDVYFLLAETYKNHLNNSEKAKAYYQKIIFNYPSSIYLVEARKSFRKLRGDNL